MPTDQPEDALLTVSGLTAGYGTSPVLHAVDITVPPATLVALLGPNGAGKTTLLRVISGLLRPSAGLLRLAGQDVTRLRPHRRAQKGLCLIPEGRGIFPSLTVGENLELQVPPWMADAELGRVLEMFPVLGSRMKQVAGTLSGGEQQMLALARAVLARPKVILVDEISMGLAPRLIDRLFEALTELAAAGISMLIVEQYVQRVLEICPLAYVLNKGAVAYSGSSDSLGRDDIAAQYLGTA
ncbi:ABC transporter ATP-binding protein [Jatrophihabitans cynanchi]|uniref:ABC transporter ATP-binding protein n=1 Tax=Jatrophihabitans cynanchi TaxID=2944128 RepID=A0ABY7K2Q5_9ACTN|nr:ABC transporter ATP-binding protein [Jatrophihabitans sp. SB3-54]WAX58475.1 ABC transporter ATP-binding protein [Jatrophihabitans sp. SB3-54]